MATMRGCRMGCRLASRLMKEQGLLSCQQPTQRYKRGSHEHIAILNHLERQLVVTEPNQMWCGDVYLDRKALGLPHCCSRSVRKETGEMDNVVLTG